MVELKNTPPAANFRLDPNPIERASELLTTALRDVLARRPRVRLAIPGGSALAAVPRAQIALGEAWRRVALTWVDERCVSWEDAESNCGAARRLGLFGMGDAERARVEPARVLPLYEDAERPWQSVARVQSELAAHFSNALDVVLLGMGADGHVASLFPARRLPENGLVAHVSNSPKPPADRITLTRKALESAATVILVAAGSSKLAALRRLVAGDLQLPAAGLDRLVIVSDLDVTETRSGGDVESEL